MRGPRGGRQVERIGLDLLLQEKPRMASRVALELAEGAIAVLLVEVDRLEVVGVYVRSLSSSSTSCLLDGAHELIPNSATPMLSGYPEMTDEQPIPMRVTRDTSDELSVDAYVNCERSMILGRGDLVVGGNEVHDDLSNQRRVGILVRQQLQLT